MDIKLLTKYGIEQEKAKQCLAEITIELEKKISKRVDQEKAILKKELDKLSKMNMIEKELLAYGARNLRSVLPLLDLDEIDFEKFDINQIKVKINNLKNDESTSFLFFEQNNSPRLKGVKPFESNFYKEKNVQSMNYEELCNHYNNNVNII